MLGWDHVTGGLQRLPFENEFATRCYTNVHRKLKLRGIVQALALRG